MFIEQKKFRYRVRMISENRVITYFKTLQEVESGLIILNHKDFMILSRDMYTGFNDIKKQEIYENDIVKRTCLARLCELDHIGVVEYSPKWAMFSINEKPGVPFNGYLPPLAYGDPVRGFQLGVEKLGDIYENADFFKGRITNNNPVEVMGKTRKGGGKKKPGY